MSLRSDAEAVKTLLTEGNGMFHLIHQFNVHPATYAHPSWFESLVPPDLLQWLQKTKRGAARLSKILLRRENLSRTTCYDF